jgi:hypothetical protein
LVLVQKNPHTRREVGSLKPGGKIKITKTMAMQHFGVSITRNHFPAVHWLGRDYSAAAAASISSVELNQGVVTSSRSKPNDSGHIDKDFGHQFDHRDQK